MRHPKRLAVLLGVLGLSAGAAAVRLATLSPEDNLFADSQLRLVSATLNGHQEQEAQGTPFTTVRRPGSVDIEKEYNLDGLTIPQDQIHTLLPRDAIPALTDPHRQAASEADWLADEARIIVVKVGDDVLGVPLGILDWHEIVNTTVGGEPVAATYCPLCDSATVFSRKVTIPAKSPDEKPETIVLEFGVSGALYNSNVLMYDRRDKALWSQLGMDALSGPLAGTELRMLPVRIISLAAFKAEFPQASIVSNQTGHTRGYGRSPYKAYFENENLLVPVKAHGKDLERKTLGMGVAVGDQAWFVPESVCKDGYTLETPAGKVHLVATDAGVGVQEMPEGIRIAQTFYYSWSAFYPNTVVVTP